MSNFLLSQDVDSDGSISTLTPTVGSLGATLSLSDDGGGAQFQASSKDPNDNTFLGFFAIRSSVLYSA